MKKLFAMLLLCVPLSSWAATCKIEEYARMGEDASNRLVPAAQEPPVATPQNVTYTTAALSATLNSQTKFVRIICDATAHYAFSVAGATTATAAYPYLPADTPEYFSIGQTGLKISFYDGSS